jgi:acetyl-CoA carboxylase carboxyl transferase subunit beta
LSVRNLTNFLVHLFGEGDELEEVYLSAVHDHCLFCHEPINDSRSYLDFRVCPFCRFHYTLSARQRIEMIADRRSFREQNRYIRSLSPLAFSNRLDSAPSEYDVELTENQDRTGLTEAAVTGTCRIDARSVVLTVLDYGFMGGSMSSIVGEKVALAFELAARRNLPMIAIVSGGGPRTQEGVLSLMQMAKTVTAVNRLRELAVPFIAVLANPSTGQAYASFANLADIIVAEPGSVVGLSPIRTVIEATGRQLPADVHTAEYHLRRGLLDNVVDRESLRPRLSQLLNLLVEPDGIKLGRRAVSRLQAPAVEDTETWESLAAATHDERPDALYYMRNILPEFFEVCGDRVSGDDRSVVGGFGSLRGHPIIAIGQQRTHAGDAEGSRYHVRPEGLRKAQRLIQLASRFNLPLVTFIDSQGADPRLESEEQGVGNAIASSLSMMLNAPTPVVSVIIGESGNEAALAMSLSDRILMQQYAVYSPISLHHTVGGPSRERYLTREAAEALMMTARDCQELGIIDQIVPEPNGGSHNNPRQAANDLEYSIYKHLAETSRISTGKLMKERNKKFRQMGELNPFAHSAIQQEVSALLRMHWAGHSDNDADLALTSGPEPRALAEGLDREAL